MRGEKTPISLRVALSPPEKTSEAQKTLISGLKSAGVDTGPAHAAPGTARKPPAAHTHLSNTGLLTCVMGSLPASTAYLLTGSLLQWRTFVQTGKTRFGVSSRAQHRSCRQNACFQPFLPGRDASGFAESACITVYRTYSVFRGVTSRAAQKPILRTCVRSAQRDVPLRMSLCFYTIHDAWRFFKQFRQKIHNILCDPTA